MLRAVLVVLAACSASPQPELAFVLGSSAGDLPALAAASSLADVRSAGFVADDAEQQRAQVERALELGVKVVVVEPGGDPAIVALAHERGARVIAYGEEVGDDSVDALVAFDGYRAGALQAEAAVAALGTGRIALLVPRDARGFSAELARGHAHTLAPYLARGAIAVTDDVTRADAVLASDAIRARAAAGTAFVASAGGDGAELVCSGQLQLDIRLERDDLAAATIAIARRFVAGEDVAKDPATSRLPGRRFPVELARVTPFTASDCR